LSASNIIRKYLGVLQPVAEQFYNGTIVDALRRGSLLHLRRPVASQSQNNPIYTNALIDMA
jgi:hypothetical protein